MAAAAAAAAGGCGGRRKPGPSAAQGGSGSGSDMLGGEDECNLMWYGGCSGLAKHVNAVEGGLPPPSPPLVPPPPQPPAAQVRRPQGGPRRAGGSLASSPHRLRLARAPVRPRDKQPTLRVWQGVVRVPAASRRIYAHTRAAGGRRWHPREWRSCACAVPRCACRCSATRVPCPPSAGTM